MIYDLQKASILKRISAWILDMVVLMIIVVGAASLISGLTGFDDYGAQLENHYATYEEEYGVVFEITEEEYNALSEEDRANYDAAYNALIADESVLRTYNMVVWLSLLVVSLGILIGYAVAEFVIPLVLKNGQTVGKKIFGIAVMRTNGVRIGTVSLFIRTFIGKYTIETMIPVLVVLMLIFNMTGLMGTLLVLGIGVAQLVLLFVTRTNATIHDLLADAVVVDLSSQMIFESEEDLLDYKKRMSAENAAQASYF